jgi:HEAT repeat protein
MGARFPTLLLSEKKTKKKKSRTGLKEELQKIIPLLRESKLLKILVLLTLMPNIVIPIMNYQFNFAVDQTFATEGKMLAFFGYFRGVLNGVSFIILLFVGRIYGRWGLPVALMFHPFNYMLAFAAFLFRFDIFSAIYARITTNILRTTINNPARGVLMGLFPPSYRGVVRPFLRGTIVRIGVLLGSGFILISEGIWHPKYLSLVAFVFVSAWIVATFFLKRSYSQILLDLISRKMLDLKSIEADDISQVFKDKGSQTKLIQSCVSARGNDCLWYAGLLQSLGTEDLDKHILATIKNQDDQTRVGLLALLSPRAGEQAVPVLEELADPENPELLIAVAKAANHVGANMPAGFYQELFETTHVPEVRAYALTGLYRENPVEYKGIMDAWLESDHVPQRRAGVIAAGESRNQDYVPTLKKMLEAEEDGSVIPYILTALRQLETPDMNAVSLPYLAHELESVRMAALEGLESRDDETLKRTIDLLNDPSEHIHELAKEKIRSASYENPLLLVEALAMPRRKVREGIFSLLESLNIKDVEVFRFVRSELEKAYVYLAEIDAVGRLADGPERDLLKDHLDQKKRVLLDNLLRVLASQDRTGQMRIIWRGISSSDARQQSNSFEALEDMMDPSLSKIMLPLMEDLSFSECLAIGKKHFQIPRFDSDARTLYTHLLEQSDWVAVVLALYLGSKAGSEGLDQETIKALAGSENARIRKYSQIFLAETRADGETKEHAMDAEISIPERILHLKGIQIFEDLAVSELAAIASVSEETTFPPGENVIKEGEPGETMYLIIEGEVAVIKGQAGEGAGQEIELDRIGAGDYFGEMALFEDVVRSATIRTAQESRLLVLHKQEFTEIVREYPQIALHICKVLSQRIRKLHEKIQRG